MWKIKKIFKIFFFLIKWYFSIIPIPFHYLQYSEWHSPLAKSNQHDREQIRTSTEAAEHRAVNIIYSFIQQDTHCVQGKTPTLIVKSIHRQTNHTKDISKAQKRLKRKKRKENMLRPKSC